MINCTELKTKIEARIEERKAQQAARVEAWEQKLNQSKLDWITRHRDRWEAALREMAAALRDDEPITTSMLPKDHRRFGDIEVWAQPPGEVSGEYQVPEAVTMLLAVLEVHGEEKITTTELSRLGIGVEQWRTVNRFLSRAWS